MSQSGRQMKRGIPGSTGQRRWQRLVALAWTASLVGSARAGLYLQEGFNYPAGTLANNAPWADVTSLLVVTNTTLTYSNLAALTPPGQACAVNAGGPALSYRPLTTPATGGVVYASCLINFQTPPGNYYIAGLLQSTNTPPGGSAADPLDLIDAASGTGCKLGVRAKGQSAVYVTNSLVPMALGTTYCVVLKYNFTNGQASLYLNPAPGGPEPANPDATSTPAMGVPNLADWYFRSGSTTAGNFLAGQLRVGSTWADVTPASATNGQLAFAGQPATTLAGAILPAFGVQLQSPPGNNLATGNVPVSVSLNGPTFASGATTVATDPTGLARFTNLVLTNAGTFTLTASAPGYGVLASTNFSILPASLDHYQLSAATTELAGVPFTVSGTALDRYGNLVTTDSATPVTLGSTPANVLYDAKNTGVYGGPGGNVLTPVNGGFSVNALDNLAQTVTLMVQDANGATGASLPINVYTNGISPQGYQLNAFLDSLEVNKYWLAGTSVNWLTGAAGGSGVNMTAGTASHCSAFAGAVTELLGVYLLRQPDASDLDLANHQAVWFTTNTAGWTAVASMLTAQQLANAGELVMASYQSASGSGHIAVLRASNRTTANLNSYGPEECQSGDYNFADTNVVTGFNQHAGAFPNGIKYYAHTLNYPLSPVTLQVGPPVRTGSTFKAGFTSILGHPYQIQWSSDLVNWNTLVSATNPENPATFFTNATFSDALSTTGRRYYRVLAP